MAKSIASPEEIEDTFTPINRAFRCNYIVRGRSSAGLVCDVVNYYMMICMLAFDYILKV